MSLPEPRLEELRLLRATQGLAHEEERELERLLADASADERAHHTAETEAWERAAAALDLALEDDESPLPESVRQRLRADADRHLASAEPAAAPASTGARGGAPPSPATLSNQPSTDRRGWRSQHLGWWAAAACLALALAAGWPRWVNPPVEDPGTRPEPTATAVAPTPAEARGTLLASVADARLLPWTATDDPSAADASGDVVWSAGTQRGYMRFRGLAANDPTEAQYQLWIFDQERDERYPVDGGVFDIEGDEVVVPIEAKLPVGEAYLFAVTVEPPGGVVVSDRSRIALLAQVDRTDA